MRDVAPLPFELGGSVRLSGDPESPTGYLVGFILTGPTLALVRWKNAAPTFEPIETLVGAPGLH